MINVHDAVKAAKESMKSVFGDDEVIDVRLEEVELSEDEKYWNITLGFLVGNPDPPEHPLVTALGGGTKKYIREYKLLKIDAETGEFKSMKIRQS